MPMFGRREIFTFLWLSAVLRSISWPLKLLGPNFLQYIPNLYTTWQQKMLVGF